MLAQGHNTELPVGSNPGHLDSESDALPLSHHAPHSSSCSIRLPCILQVGGAKLQSPPPRHILILIPTNEYPALQVYVAILP